jgi:hypothetical protein
MAEWNRRIACQYNPVEHQLLQSRDGLTLDAKRLRPLDVKLGRVGAGVIEHVLCRNDVAAGRLVIFAGDAVSQAGRRQNPAEAARRAPVLPYS